MSHELFYTSVPRGLRPGDQGFCTVAVTRGIPAGLAAKLETLSAYRHLHPPEDGPSPQNPVLISHLRVRADGKTYHVVSRVADAGLDYSNRTNKFAHHVALESDGLPVGGPAFVARQPGFLETAWDGEPRFLTTGRRPRDGEPPPGPCRAWAAATGDAGWAGVFAAATDPSHPAYIIYDAGRDVLPLIGEALALLPPRKRWDVSFSTYFHGLPPDVVCEWRCVADGTAEAREARSRSGSTVIDLTVSLGPPPDGPLVEAARTGQAPEDIEEFEPIVEAPTPVPIIRLPSDRVAPPARKAKPMPATHSAPATRSGGVGPLLLGLALGALLGFAAVVLLELLTGRTMPRLAGMVGHDEQEAIDKAEALTRQLADSETRATAAVTERDATREQLSSAKAALKTERDRAGQIQQVQADAEAAKAKVRELEEEIRRLKKPPAGQTPPPEAKPPEPKPPEPKPPAAKPIPDLVELPKWDAVLPPGPAKLFAVAGRGDSKLALLGWPDRIRSAPLKAEWKDGVLVLTIGQDKTELARFTIAEGQCSFSWAQVQTHPDAAQARDFLKYALLVVTDGAVKDHPVAFGGFPEKKPPPLLGRDKETGNKLAFYGSEYRLAKDAGWQLEPGESATVDFDNGTYELVREGAPGRLVSKQGGDLSVEMTVTESGKITVVVTGQPALLAPIKKCTVTKLTINRRVQGWSKPLPLLEYAAK